MSAYQADTKTNYLDILVNKYFDSGVCRDKYIYIYTHSLAAVGKWARQIILLGQGRWSFICSLPSEYG